MSLFGSIRDLLSPSQPSSTSEAFTLPFGLTPAKWRSLKNLTMEDGWEVYLEVLDEVAKLNGDRILQSSDAAALHFLRGHVAGLRKAGTTIKEIERAEKRHISEKERIANVRTRDPSSLYGSPGWRPQSQRRASGS